MPCSTYSTSSSEEVPGTPPRSSQVQYFQTQQTSDGLNLPNNYYRGQDSNPNGNEHDTVASSLAPFTPFDNPLSCPSIQPNSPSSPAGADILNVIEDYESDSDNEMPSPFRCEDHEIEKENESHEDPDDAPHVEEQSDILEHEQQRETDISHVAK